MIITSIRYENLAKIYEYWWNLKICSFPAGLEPETCRLRGNHRTNPPMRCAKILRHFIFSSSAASSQWGSWTLDYLFKKWKMLSNYCTPQWRNGSMTALGALHHVLAPLERSRRIFHEDKRWNMVGGWIFLIIILIYGFYENSERTDLWSCDVDHVIRSING